MEERIEGLRRSVAAVSQRLVAPQTWLGSEAVNVLQVVCDLLDLVKNMNTQLANHTHGASPLPQMSGEFLSNALISLELAAKLKGITY